MIIFQVLLFVFYRSLPGDLFGRRQSYNLDTGADLGKWETVNCVQLKSECLACSTEVCACEDLFVRDDGENDSGLHS